MLLFKRDAAPQTRPESVFQAVACDAVDGMRSLNGFEVTRRSLELNVFASPVREGRGCSIPSLGRGRALSKLGPCAQGNRARSEQ